MKKQSYKKIWPRKNLGELLNFLEEQHPEGLSLHVLAEKFNMTTAGVSNMFRKDDCRLSKIEEIADRYGYKLILYFPVRTFLDGYVPAPPKKTYPNAGNISGMVKYFQDSEYSIPFVAEYMHILPAVLRYAFNKGDIKVSIINKFQDAFGKCVVWDFKKKDES